MRGMSTREKRKINAGCDNLCECVRILLCMSNKKRKESDELNLTN